jgi:transcriptional regulator with XRE-family HTH domain
MGWPRLGRRIRSLREVSGLSREVLAERAGLSAVYLRKLEAGDRSAPSLPVLARIAHALGAELRVALVVPKKPMKGAG